MMIANHLTENKEIAKQYKELLRISYQTLSESDKKIIRLSFDMAVEAHSDQRRKSGEAYIFGYLRALIQFAERQKRELKKVKGDLF